MKIRMLVLVLAILLAWSGAHAAGTIENRQFYSGALQEDRWVQVYLPEGYDPQGSTYYPAIYFLHGADGNHLGYPELIGYLDALIGTAQMNATIVIKPDGSGCAWDPYWEGCGWVDSELQGDYETYLIEDVIPFAEEHYRIIQSRAKRAIMGHSMGGFGSMYAAVKHPDMFAAVAAHSGYPHFEEMRNQHVPLIIMEQESLGDPPWNYTPNMFFTGAWFMFAGGFSPDLGNPPYLVDFPLDPYGDLLPGVWARWLEHDPATIVMDLPPEMTPQIYFDCGTSDEFYLSAVNVAFDAHLTQLGIPHDFESFAGGHWAPWRFQTGLEFIDSAFGDNAAVPQTADSGRPGAIVRFDVRSPAPGSADIHLERTGSGPTTLDVFDVQGRLRATVLDRVLQAGTHHVVWETAGFPSGIYFVRLQTASARKTRTVVVP